MFNSWSAQGTCAEQREGPACREADLHALNELIIHPQKKTTTVTNFLSLHMFYWSHVTHSFNLPDHDYYVIEVALHALSI